MVDRSAAPSVCQRSSMAATRCFSCSPTRAFRTPCPHRAPTQCPQPLNATATSQRSSTSVPYIRSTIRSPESSKADASPGSRSPVISSRPIASRRSQRIISSTMRCPIRRGTPTVKPTSYRTRTVSAIPSTTSSAVWTWRSPTGTGSSSGRETTCAPGMAESRSAN